MSFDNLFQQLNDIQFQADKLLKSKQMKEKDVRIFAKYSNELKSSLINLKLDDELYIHVKDIEEITFDLRPKLPLVTTILGVLSFGKAVKKYRSRVKEEYYKENIRNIKKRFANIDKLLKEA